jgi:hypothetical protein
MGKTMNALIRHRQQIISGAVQRRADRIIINVLRNQIRKFESDDDDDQRPIRRVKPEPEVIKSDPRWGSQLKSLFFLTDRAAIDAQAFFWDARCAERADRTSSEGECRVIQTKSTSRGGKGFSDNRDTDRRESYQR